MDMTQRIDINKTVMTGGVDNRTVAMNSAPGGALGRTTAMAPLKALEVEVIAGRSISMANGPAREQYLLELRAGGSNELLCTMYNDTMLLQYLLQVNRDQFTNSAESLGFDRKVYLGGRSDSMSAAQTKTFYLPLVNSPFSAVS